MRCDLHVHSRFSTDSGNFALRRARLGESFTEPERVHRICCRRGMGLVTISDHNTLEGALRIAHLPGTFLSVEVTTRFPEDEVPLHVLVWNLTEEDHADLQPLRGSVYELVAALRERGLVHALAHPLYRMGPPLTARHVERMMLLFGIWEGRNGARPEEANALACRLAQAVTPEYLAKLEDRHGFAAMHDGSIALTGGSDDHGAFDVATTWTEAGGDDPASFLTAVAAGAGAPGGEHGSTLKLAHAVGGLLFNAYRERGGVLPPAFAGLATLVDEDANDPAERHRELEAVSARAAKLLAQQARDGGLGVGDLAGLGRRLGLLVLAGTLHAPYFSTAHHHAGSRAGLYELESSFFGLRARERPPRALVFTDTLEETNGVARTMRTLAAAGAAGRLELALVTADGPPRAGVHVLEPEWSVALPTYEAIALRFPSPTAVLSLVERERPDVVHVATPGPLGACGLIAAKALGLPLVGSWHTELGPYALHLTRDLLVAETFERYVEAFYRQCGTVLAPTHAVAAALEAKGIGDGVGVWGRGVDADRFTPALRTIAARERLLDGGDLLLLSVGRVSREKRLDVLLDAFRSVATERPSVRLLVVGDGPARGELEASSPPGVRFAGELRGPALAEAYANADLFCFPSTTDTFGQVLLEAAASGLPAIAVAAGGAPELVRDGCTGMLVPADDAGAFAAAIRRLAASEDMRRTYGAAGRAFALERNWERSFDELSAAYEAAAATRPLKAPVVAA